jgi:hypothetical protein
MPIHIIQDGSDGFGHQLHGLFTTLIFHDVSDGHYYFNGFSFIEKEFRFEHVTVEEAAQLASYLKRCLEIFVRDFNLNKAPIPFTSIIRSHEIWKIPAITDEKTLYSLDNVFSCNHLFPQLCTALQGNIDRMKHYFINDMLPAKRLTEKNIVLHVRMGDALTAGRGHSIYQYNAQIIKLIPLLKSQYPEHWFYVHSDGEVPTILAAIGPSYTFFGKHTPVLDMLSDAIHAKIFIEGNSSLSKAASFLGNKQVIITHDDNIYSRPNENCYKISEYLEKK